MSEKSDKQWFVMRDLTRPIAKRPAYVMLEEMGIEYYTPMISKVVVRGGKRVRKQVPFLHDLIFVHDTRSVLDPIVESVPTFQYRFSQSSCPASAILRSHFHINVYTCSVTGKSLN